MKAMFCDMYNFQITWNIASNLNATSCDSPTHSGPSLFIVNNLSKEIHSASFILNVSSKAGNIGFENEVTPTVLHGAMLAVVIE